MASSAVHQAVVRYIVSGDTLVVKSKNQSDIGEQRISLNHIIAPALARPPTDNDGKGASPDEPYAFECREYLRKKLVGRDISYTVDFQIPESNRLMCSVYLGADPLTSENLIESLLREGLVELKTQKGARAKDPKYQRLVQISQEAKTKQVGRYSTDHPEQHIRDMKWKLLNPREFVERHKSSAPMDAIVEFIRDGNTLRCLLLPTYYLVTIQLTGIRCPIISHEGNSGLIPEDEPFAQEAKGFVKNRLLQREVKIVFGGVNNQNLVGTLLHPNGNISLFLLREGLAKCDDWKMGLLPPAWREQYRTAEKFAKDHRLRLWKDYVARTNTYQDEQFMATNGKTYQAQVLEIVNADALIIRDLRNNETRKIYLSSVRTPRAADLSSTENGATSAQISIKRPLYDIPYLWEGHEFLRKRLIGKTVRIDTDYVQKATKGYPEKISCTVYLDTVNIGEALISKGLAHPLRHRQDDEQRSSHYDDLLAAEQQAMKRGLGLFSTNKDTRRIIDMTGESNKKPAQGLLDLFKRNGRMDGIVESVASGSRFRIHLLRDNYLISFLLSSIQCPRPERRVTGDNDATTEKIEPAEPFGTEALNFAKEHFLQRDVIVEVENVHRAGNFIGRLTMADGQSAALMLVQAGLAKVQTSSARHSPDAKLLADAEEKCKRQRLGIWTNYEEPNTIEQEQQVDEQTEGHNYESDIVDFNSPNFHRVMVTYVSSDFKVYVQYSNQGHLVEQLQSDLRSVLTEKEPIVEYDLKKGQLAAAQFSADNEWYRVRVEKIESNNRLSVYYIDYGNREVITDTNRLAALPPDFTKLPGQAHEYELAYVRPPPDSDDRDEARNTLLQTIDNNECLIRVEYRRSNVEYISLYNATTQENFVKTLAEQGLIIIAQGRLQNRAKPLLKELRQAQNMAKTSRIGLWQYSDQIEDDATEFGFTGRK